MKTVSLALFFKSTSQLQASCEPIANVFKAGTITYVADENHAEDVQQYFPKQSVNIFNSEEFLLRSTVFNLSDVQKSFTAFLSKLKSSTLIFIEMSWMIRSPSAAVYAIHFYKLMEDLCEHYELKICYLFNSSLLLDEMLLNALKSQPHLWLEGKVTNNPYYVPIDTLIKKKNRAQFNYWMQQLQPDFDSGQTQNISGKIQPIYNLNNAPAAPIAQNSEEGGWKIRCLGKLKVYREYGELINWNSKHGSTRKMKTLFAYLLFKGEKGAAAEELADMLWPEEDFDVSANRLHQTIRLLKLVLSPELKVKKETSPFIIREGKFYHLALPQDSWIDLTMFQELCFRGNAHFKNKNFKEALICYQGAERMYLGELFQDIPKKYIDNYEHDWCYSRRQWYKEMHQKLLLESSIMYRSLNDITNALAACDKALSIEPYSEKITQEKLQVLFDAQRKDAFQRQYKVYAKTLEKFDLGLPSKEMTAFYKKYADKF